MSAKKIFGPKRGEVTGKLKRLHNEELYDLTKYYSGDQIKNHEICGACGTNGGSGEVHAGVWWGSPREKIYLEHLGVDGRMILKLIFKSGMGIWTGLTRLRIRTVAGFCGYSNQLSVSIKCGDFLDYLRIF
jgi:hypothetical protein